MSSRARARDLAERAKWYVAFARPTRSLAHAGMTGVAYVFFAFLFVFGEAAAAFFFATFAALRSFFVLLRITLRVAFTAFFPSFNPRGNAAETATTSTTDAATRSTKCSLSSFDIVLQ